ncbi:hypothetical protein INT48_003416 [Thamnidium elegans]|uniref:Protein kinase domain-containing protein n=1 Tax=Thamnidium elegans TaxID=101142 RepID=A0A8H7VZP0_9FUNG|nr:hypothetical protein INT48_003416 [Thamnidium elegans]
MSQKETSPTIFNSSVQQRPRSSSVIRAMSGQNSPTQSPTTSTSTKHSQFKRSVSLSEGLHVRLPTLHHSETEPYPYSPVTQQNPNPSCPSDSNWANKYDDFDIGNPIGYGSSAVVYEAIYKPLKKRVAIKMIDLDMFERNQIDELRRETALMALSKHPNVLRVYGSFVNGAKLYIVTPYLAAGSCLDIMKSSFPDGFDEISIATILRQALEGLIYLHKNGHIHRDVKAGNLLMDQQGTVLLADFGVSSSLAENGDVRKTFVGTPCWMAPEVMEQAGYDYKADIWSFGITSLELATGHAPFAKFPPMKVLMMTLSNAPPTLDRENGKHKFSKYFKDMIDLCLQKEPNKRPSAEKLLLHPFFKQAKKKDYLVKSVLAHVLPLNKRPHRKLTQKSVSTEPTEQWDFDDTQPNNENSTPTIENPAIVVSALNAPQQVLVEGASSAPQADSVPLERSKSVVQFENCPKPPHIKPTTSTNASPIETGESTPVKKHISFGEAVIKDPSSVRSIMSPVVESPSPIMSPLTETTYAPPVLSSAPLSKKSRFVIQDNAPAPQAPTAFEPFCSSTASPPPLSVNELPPADVGLGICTTPSSASITNTNITNINTVPGTLQEGEFKKGRFSVNQTPTRPITPVDESQQIVNGAPTPAANNEKPLLSEFKPTPMARVASQDSFQERKSRFEVKHNNPSTAMATPSSIISTPIEPGTPFQSLPLTRENSNTSALSKDSSVNNKVSRFSIEKPEPVGPYCELPTAMSPECRKKGRFELTGGSDSSKEFINHLESPQSTVAPSPAISPSSSLSRGQAHRILDPSMPQMVYSHMESLLKQTEIQKNMLHDLLATMPLMYNNSNNSQHLQGITRSRTVSDTKRPPATTSNEELYQRVPATNPVNSTPSSLIPPYSLSTDITTTVDHLQQLLASSSKERERLARENEALRREKPSLESPIYQQPEKLIVAPEAQDNKQ